MEQLFPYIKLACPAPDDWPLIDLSSVQLALRCVQKFDPAVRAEFMGRRRLAQSTGDVGRLTGTAANPDEEDMDQWTDFELCDLSYNPNLSVKDMPTVQLLVSDCNSQS